MCLFIHLVELQGLKDGFMRKFRVFHFSSKPPPPLRNLLVGVILCSIFDSVSLVEGVLGDSCIWKY